MTDDDFYEWIKTIKIHDTETGITYDSYEQMVASWNWKRRVREAVVDLWFFRIRRPIRDVKWWLLHRLHPKHRYNVIRTGLPAGYYDVVTLMPAAIIKLFKDYIEIEKPFEHFDTDESHNKAHWDNIKRLYEYFKDIDPLMPPHEKTRIPRGGNQGDWDAHNLVYKVREKRFIKNLCEVVSLYQHYWT